MTTDTDLTIKVKVARMFVLKVARMFVLKVIDIFKENILKN